MTLATTVSGAQETELDPDGMRNDSEEKNRRPWEQSATEKFVCNGKERTWKWFGGQVEAFYSNDINSSGIRIRKLLLSCAFLSSCL